MSVFFSFCIFIDMIMDGIVKLVHGSCFLHACVALAKRTGFVIRNVCSSLWKIAFGSKKIVPKKKYLYFIHTVFVPKVFVDDYFPFNMIRAIRKKMQSKPCLLCIKLTEVSWQIPCSELGMWICSSNVIESATRTQMDYDSRRVVSTHFQLSRLRTIIFW